MKKVLYPRALIQTEILPQRTKPKQPTSQPTYVDCTEHVVLTMLTILIVPVGHFGCQLKWPLSDLSFFNTFYEKFNFILLNLAIHSYLF